MPRQKELWFFNIDNKYNVGEAYYRSYFYDWRGEVRVGDATPTYFNKGILYKTDDRASSYHSPDRSSLERMHDMIPDAKIIISLRSPIDRLLSEYRKGRAQNKSSLDNDISVQIRKNLREVGEVMRGNLVYLNQYRTLLEHVYDVYPENQVKVLVLEEWADAVQETARTVFQFLDLDPNIEVLAPKSKNSFTEYLPETDDSAPQQIDADLQDELRQIFADDIAFVERLLGRDLPDWRKTS